MATHLFFDTETADLPWSYNAPASDLRNWPRVVQIAWIACDARDDSIKPEVHLIRPDGFTISIGSFQRHKISTAFAKANGVPLLPVLNALHAAIQSAEVLVAHNFEFDAPVIGAEFLRAGLTNPVSDKSSRCTMKGATNFCKLPGKFGDYKWPRLDELHAILFKSTFDGAHGAGADCLACMKCFFRLKELQVLS